MLGWLAGMFRARVFPDAPREPVRVDVVGKVLSPNLATSPITGLTGAVIDIQLVDVRSVPRNVYDDDPPREYTWLGGTRYGNELVVADRGGRRLVIDASLPFRVVPLAKRPEPLDVAPPRELALAAQRSKHFLMYGEVRFRENDLVRVVATIKSAVVASQDGGYRDATREVLVPVTDQRFELHELL
jgi:hypothetical protein